jgi:V8-like Glu-specific endopeptidase
MAWRYLGLEYIQHRAKIFVVPITGSNQGQQGIGTGTLINNDTILTCAHVLNDMEIDSSVKIFNSDYEIKTKESHDKIDVGIIKLKKSIQGKNQIVFGEANILDDILTMGYPPIPMTRDAYLISQKGEINSLVQNYFGDNNFIYSSITRPGNSWGPIFSKRGHLVGISARHLENQSSNDKNVLPFFEGISSNEVINALKDLDPYINILYEDYN